jgi:hypothetical protein
MLAPEPARVKTIHDSGERFLDVRSRDRLGPKREGGGVTFPPTRYIESCDVNADGSSILRKSNLLVDLETGDRARC